MKKTLLTLAIVLGLGFCTFAQEGGGLFGYGENPKEGDEEELVNAWYALGNNDEIDNSLFGLMRYANNTPLLPNHNENTNQDAPLGGGALLLIGFGAAYALKKRKH